MNLDGIVKNGVVVLANGPPPPDGTTVRIEVTGPTVAESTLAADLLDWAGKGRDLPDDLALNHDHYLHGQPKK